MKRYFQFFSIFFVVALVTLPAAANKNNDNAYELLNLFGEVFERVKDDYVEDVENDQLIENAINGMLSSLDPHSGYLSNKAFKEMQVQTKGEFGGLGIEVTMENGLVKVVSPIDDTPAFKAGILAGDYISHIDGEQVLGLSLSEAVEKMRGRVGTKIDLTILREGASEPMEKTITRDIIKIQTVKSRIEGEDVGYLRVTAFSEQTSVNLKKEIKKIKKDLGKDLQGYVLDLRNNPGGLLDQAIEVADIFLNKGEIVSTRGRVAGSGKRYDATTGDMTNAKPVVVLINAGSASASEIVAGALQDHDRAIVMGVKSFGKGSVQTVIPLTGHGAMRLTTSRYYTPSGRSIQAEGIEPDIEVKQAKLEYVEQSKYFRTEKSLDGHLENDDNGKKSGTNVKKLLTKASKDDKEKLPDDYQLSRAVDLIRGLNVFGK